MACAFILLYLIKNAQFIFIVMQRKSCKIRQMGKQERCVASVILQTAAHDYYTLFTQSLCSEMDNKDEELLFVMLHGLWCAVLFMFSERNI